MSFFIYVFTDNNRTKLEICIDRSQITDQMSLKGMRLVYQERFVYEDFATTRLQELRTFTRMQLERLIRRHNPNWINLDHGLAHLSQGMNYHPGAKLSPNVPNFTSLR